MASVQIQCIIIVIVAVENLDAFNPHPVASQIVLHPASGVPQRNVLDDDILTLDETQQMRTGHPLVVPGEFLKGAATSVYRTIAVYRHMTHLVSKDQLDGSRLCTQGYIVGFQRLVVLQVRTAIQCCPLFQIKMNKRFQDNRAYLIMSRRHHHPASAIFRTVVYGMLQG